MLFLVDEAIGFVQGGAPHRKFTASPSEFFQDWCILCFGPRYSEPDTLQVSKSTNNVHEGFIVPHTGPTRGIIKDPHAMNYNSRMFYLRLYTLWTASCGNFYRIFSLIR